MGDTKSLLEAFDSSLKIQVENMSNICDHFLEPKSNGTIVQSRDGLLMACETFIRFMELRSKIEEAEMDKNQSKD